MTEEVKKMPTRLREEFDADVATEPVPTDYRTETNSNEVPCSVCGKTFYVDDQTKQDIERALENDIEDPFVCVDCVEAEYDELAYR
jgi:hypothetical protein